MFLWFVVDRYGKTVATWPVAFIIGSLFICGLCTLGLFKYTEEGNPYKLWIPQESDFVKNSEWLWENFPPDLRFHSVIITADNVLEPSVIQHVRRPLKQLFPKAWNTLGVSFRCSKFTNKWLKFKHQRVDSPGRKSATREWTKVVIMFWHLHALKCISREEGHTHSKTV